MAGLGIEDKVVVFMSDGAAPPSFVQYTVSSTADGAGGVFLQDMNSDGALDLLVSSTDDSKVTLYLSDGASPPNFFARVVSSGISGPRLVVAAQFTSNGAVDVLAAFLGADRVVLFRSDGAPAPSFAAQDIATTADGAIGVFAVDMNADGALDALSVSLYDDTVAMYLSNGASPPSFARQVISSAADSASSVVGQDMNDDGLVDGTYRCI